MCLFLKQKKIKKMNNNKNITKINNNLYSVELDNFKGPFHFSLAISNFIESIAKDRVEIIGPKYQYFYVDMYTLNQNIFFIYNTSTPDEELLELIFLYFSFPGEDKEYVSPLNFRVKPTFDQHDQPAFIYVEGTEVEREDFIYKIGTSD